MQECCNPSPVGEYRAAGASPAVLQLLSQDEYAAVCRQLNEAIAQFQQPCTGYLCLCVFCFTGCCIYAGLSNSASAGARAAVTERCRLLTEEFRQRGRDINFALTLEGAPGIVLVTVPAATPPAPVAMHDAASAGFAYPPQQQHPGPGYGQPAMGYPQQQQQQQFVTPPYAAPYDPYQSQNMAQQQQQYNPQHHQPPFDPYQMQHLPPLPPSQPNLQHPYDPNQGQMGAQPHGAIGTCPRCGVHLAPDLLARHESKCRV